MLPAGLARVPAAPLSLGLDAAFLARHLFYFHSSSSNQDINKATQIRTRLDFVSIPGFMTDHANAKHYAPRLHYTPSHRTTMQCSTS